MLVTCPACGAKISEDARFCPKCGKPDAGYYSVEVQTRQNEIREKIQKKEEEERQKQEWEAKKRQEEQAREGEFSDESHVQRFFFLVSLFVLLVIACIVLGIRSCVM